MKQEMREDPENLTEITPGFSCTCLSELSSSELNFRPTGQKSLTFRNRGICKPVLLLEGTYRVSHESTCKVHHGLC